MSRRPKTSLSSRDLKHFRALLLEKRAEIVADLGAMEQHARESDAGDLSRTPIHAADLGTDVHDQELLRTMAEGERELLHEIDEALQRLEDGTYGICQRTGDPIPKSRLEAKPWAQYTVEAERELERGLDE